MKNMLNTIGNVFYWFLVAYAVFSGIRSLIKKDYIHNYRNIDFKLYLWIVPLIVVIMGVVFLLLAINPVIFWASWPSLLGLQLGNTGYGENLSLAGTDIRYWGILICILLLIQLPALVRFEEEKYRKGTRNWADGSLRSLAFGLTHMLVGVPLAAGLALTLAGLFLTYMYFKGGIELSTQAHFQYDLLLFGIALIIAIVSAFL
jgi:membrane protease YdiL (CAAX protease family)